MEQEEYVHRIEAVAEARGRFHPEAYLWILRALDFTRRRFQRPGHVSGQELLEGTRLLALEEYGPMAADVFRHWGLTGSQDFGRIVFDLVEEELLSKEESDTLEDFAHGYDFDQAFVRDYRW